MNSILFFSKSFFKLAFIIISAITINIILFTFLPIINQLIGNDFFKTFEKSPKRLIVAEYVKKKDVKKQNNEKRVRKVNLSNSGKRSTESSSMRFTPDLSANGTGVGIKSQKMEAVVFNEGETDEDLVAERITQIPYPDRAKNLSIEGTIIIEIVIGTTGKVESIEIISSPHPSFDKAVKTAVNKWRFKPAKNKGIPVKVRARKEIEFNLN